MRPSTEHRVKTEKGPSHERMTVGASAPERLPGMSRHHQQDTGTAGARKGNGKPGKPERAPPPPLAAQTTLGVPPTSSATLGK